VTRYASLAMLALVLALATRLAHAAEPEPPAEASTEPSSDTPVEDDADDEADALPLVRPDLGMSGFEGRLTLDYAPRFEEGTGYEDHDVYAGLLMRWGDTSSGASGSVYWRGAWDLDGYPAGIPSDDPFRSSYDYLGDTWSSWLYHGYLDLRGDSSGFGSASLTRIGRQFVYEGLPFHFDGVRYETRKMARGLRLLGFAGLPVHHFEESSSGDWLAGAGLELRPIRGVKAGVLFAHLTDEARLVGLPAATQNDNLIVARGNVRLGYWGALLVRFTALDFVTRDVLVRARALLQRLNARLAVTYRVQPVELAETVVEASPYEPVKFASHPFTRADVSAFKDFDLGGWRLGLGGRGTIRRLSDPADEEMYNRDYDVLWFGLELDAPSPRKLTISAGQTKWWSFGNATDALAAEVRWQPSEALRLAVGTGYSLFRYDVLTNTEETDVLDTYLRLRWRGTDRDEFRLRYSYEDQSGEQVHEVRLGCSYGF